MTRLYTCRVSHARLSPRKHRFAYRAFYLAIDLDELPRLATRFRLFSINAGNVFSFRERDYLPLDRAETSLRDRVALVLSARGIDLGAGQVELITLPRMLGYLFNPVSFYFCRDDQGQPLAAIVEVTNTYREVKLFVLGPSCWRDGAFRLRATKEFYVSPYSDVDVTFDFTLRPAGDRLAVQIEDFAGDERTFTSALTGHARPLSDARLAWYFVAHPLLTLRVITLIHWHALLLLLKRTPSYSKRARLAEQHPLDPTLFRPV